MYISEKITHTTAGLVGEHIATAAILQRAWGCAMTQQDGFDLIAVNGRESYRVQVKSCALSFRPRQSCQFIIGIGKSKRLPTREDWDIIALVSSEQRSVIFKPLWDAQQSKLTIPASYFTAEAEIESWEKTIRDLRNEKEFTKPPSLRHNKSGDGSGRHRIVSPPNRRGS